MALRTARFYHHESCGKCTPCREGTNWTVKMLERVVRGEATPMDLDIVASVQENIIGHCLCVLGDSMAMPVGAMVRKFRPEFEACITAASSAPAQAKESDMDSPVLPRPGAAGAKSAGGASI
jgi:NADH-quinone oxidoreductase subunit F